MKIILIGYGNVGKELKTIFDVNNIAVDLIVRSNGIFNYSNSKVDENKNLTKYLDSESCVFICVPSRGKGEEASKYYLDALQKNTKIVTCEKAFLANHWEFIEKFKNQIRYSATVGGDSGILNAISEYKCEIKEIKAVVNGTLNYAGEKLAQGFSKKEVYDDITAKGFAEPDSKNFDEVIENELKDVAYKTLIIANHSKLYSHLIKPENVKFKEYNENFRCAVLLNKKDIEAGFIQFEDMSWFPKGVENTLYINGKKVIEGLGAGGKITAERMFKDFKELMDLTPLIKF